MKKILLLLLFCTGTFCAFSQTDSSADTTNFHFNKVELEAQFKGGMSAWIKYLQGNLKANVPVKNNAPIGNYQVIVRFIVSKTGKISDVVAETSHGYGMEEEVIRIIKSGPDWEPARQNSKPVNAYRRQPVTFAVQQEGINIIARNQLLKDKENIILLTVDRVDNTDLELESNNGIISYDSGRKYILKPSGKGKAIVDIYKIKNKKRKKVASAFFEVI